MKKADGSITYTEHRIYLNGMRRFYGKQAAVCLYDEVGVILAAGVILPAKPVRQELIRITKEGTAISDLLLVEMLARGSIDCQYDEDLNAYWWIRSKERYQKLIMNAIGKN